MDIKILPDDLHSLPDNAKKRIQDAIKHPVFHFYIADMEYLSDAYATREDAMAAAKKLEANVNIWESLVKAMGMTKGSK